MPTPEDPAPTPAPPPPDPAPAPVVPWYDWRKFIPTNWQSILTTILVNAMIAVLVAVGWVKEKPVPVPVPTPVWPDGWVVPDDGKPSQGFATGWRAPTEDERKSALASPRVYQWKDTEAGAVPGADDKGNIFLWKASVKARGAVIPCRDQLSVGSCVSFGGAGAYETTLDVQVAMGKVQRSVDVAQEVLYGGARVEGLNGFPDFGPDGATGAGLAKWLTSGGALERKVYGSIDLTKYSTTRCRQFGRTGVPDELEPLAKENLASCALVEDADQLLQAISNGYGVFVCSGQGFDGKRDADGFCRPFGRWGHCMYINGYRADRKGFHIQNSWGPDWKGTLEGPDGPGEPTPGGFWADWNTVDRMLKSYRDSYAVSAVKGFPRRKLNPDDWTVKAAPRPVFGRWDAPFALAP